MIHTTTISFPQGQPSSRTFGEWSHMDRGAVRYGRSFAYRKRCRALFRDEAIYTEPYTFNPERFLKDGTLDPLVKDPEGIVFGFGRRCRFSVCSPTNHKWLIFTLPVEILHMAFSSQNLSRKTLRRAKFFPQYRSCSHPLQYRGSGR